MNTYKLIQGDSRKVLPTLKKNSIDMIITDPPYGFKRFKTDDEGCVVLTREVLEKATPLLKDGAFVFVFGPTNKTLIEMVNNIPLQFHRLLWLYKINDVSYPWGKWMMKSEAIMVFTNGKPNFKSLHGKCVSDTFIHKHSIRRKIKHPTIKPLPVIQKLVESSIPNALILDPFLGSGTTMVACQERGRNCIGIEINPEYVDVIKQRCFGRTFLDREVTYEFSEFVHNSEEGVKS